MITHIDGVGRDAAQIAHGANEARVEVLGDSGVSLTVIDTPYGIATLFLDLAGVYELSSALTDAARQLTPGMEEWEAGVRNG